MANLFEDAFSALGADMRDSAGVTVTIRDGASSTGSIVAVPGVTTHIVEEAGTGLRVSLRTDDFHIAIDDFQFDSIAAKPAPGMTIEYTRGGKLRVFQVIEPGGMNCFTLVDADSAYRIHTVNVSEESA